MEITEVIKSKRKFGVELEVGNKVNRPHELSDLIHRYAQIKGDGSLQIDNPREIVTIPLSGSTGAGRLVEICNAARQTGYHADHPSCGMHVHIQANDFIDKAQAIVVKKDGIKSFLEARGSEVIKMSFINNSILKQFKSRITDGNFILVFQKLKSNIYSLASRNLPESRSIMYREEDGVIVADVVNNEDVELFKILRQKKYRSLGEMGNDGPSIIKYQEASEKINQWYEKKISSLIKIGDGKYVVEVSDKAVTEKLRKVFLFYYIFEPVILGMTAPSRKEKNAYCQKLTESFDLESILACKSYSDIQKLWYKENNDNGLRRSISTHYHDSRYHFVNLHSLWDRTGTIELRCHGGTVDEKQILLWTALHQAIIDAVAEGKISQEALLDANTLGDDQKVGAMLDIIDAPEHLRKYVIKMYNHFTQACAV